MDGFGDNFDDTEVDPAAEFLAREQDQLAGLEDELKPAVTPIVNGSAHLDANESTGSFEMINSLGQNDTGFDVMTNNSKEEVAAPNYEEQELNNINEALHAAGQPVQTNDTDEKPKLAPSPSPVKQVREEPEKIKKWREEQKKSLEEKDKNEEKKKEELRIAAKKELDEWYKHHEELIAKTRAVNRESAKNAEKQFVAEAGAIEPGTEWERIAKLCDFNPKSTRTSKDVSRMRSIILQLKQNPPPAVNNKHG